LAHILGCPVGLESEKKRGLAVGQSVLGLRSKSIKRNKIKQNFVRTDSNLAVSEARVTVMSSRSPTCVFGRIKK
jgi:hypothetical protein